MPPKEDGLFHMVAMETWCGYQACLCSTIVTQPWTLIWELESCLHPSLLSCGHYTIITTLLGLNFLKNVILRNLKHDRGLLVTSCFAYVKF